MFYIYALGDEDELKQDNKSYHGTYKEVEDDILCNKTKHELHLDIDYEELENFSLVQLDEEEDDAELSLINPDLLDLDLDDSDASTNYFLIHNFMKYVYNRMKINSILLMSYCSMQCLVN